MSAVLDELFTGRMVEQFNHADTATFLDGITDNSDKVKYNVIHLVEIGQSPDVLINNNVYPIPTQALDDADIAISLAKFQTLRTVVTEDELYAMTYDKVDSVKKRHQITIKESRQDLSAYNIAPTSNTPETPVIAASGPDDGTGRLRMVRNDIITLHTKFNELKVPKKDRRLVLSNVHVGDLLIEDSSFSASYTNHKEGLIANLYGFDIYQYGNNPLFTALGTKKAFNALQDPTDRECSFAFLKERIWKATGDTIMYYDEPTPAYQEHAMNFRHYYVALPEKLEALGAIY